MDTARRKIYSAGRAGIAVGIAIAFFAGLTVAIVLFANGFEVKREIDIIEVTKVTLLAAAAFLWQRYETRRLRAREGEREQLLTLIDEIIEIAADAHKLFRTAEISERGAVSASSREQLIRSFDTLDSYIILLERMLFDCDCSSIEDKFVAANEKYNDVVMNNGLTAAAVSQPRAEEAYRALHLALWRARLRIVRL